MNTHTSITSVSRSSIETETCKAIIITIAGHLLAIPVSTVYKIIRSSLNYSINNVGTNQFKLINLEERVLPIIDLHDILREIKPANNLEARTQFLSEDEKFFVLARTNKNIAAIVVDEPPTLMDLPLENTYLLPAHEQKNINSIATHIAVVPLEKSNLTIFLLDIQQALTTTGFSNS